MTGFLLKRQHKILLIFSAILMSTVNVFSQISISGTVVSALENEPLPGVNVVIKGTTTGTITDIDGNYTITAPSREAVIVFSMVGMVSEEIPVGDQTEINVSMIADLVGLDELVVVGYGTMKKSDISGSIVSVKGEDLVEIKTVNVLEALQGKVPGLDISPTNGRPGAGVDALIRGKTTLRGENDPLVIVDNIPMGTNVDINPNDIESIEVLKDAASTAIYGSRGTNGIILITTKKGKEGTAKAYYNGYYSITNPAQKIPVFDRDGYVEAKINANRDIYNWDVEPDPTSVFGSTELYGYENDISTDWQDLITRQGHQQDHHFGVTGGTDRITYNTSVSYFDEKGIVIEDYFKRYSTMLNLDVKVNNWLSAGTITQLHHRILDGADVSSSNYNVFTNAVLLSPMVEAYDSTGKYIWQPAAPNPRKSPLAKVDDTEEDRRTRIFANVYANIKFMDGLNFKTTFGADYTAKRRGYIYTQKAPGEAVTENGVEMRYESGWTWNNILTLDKTFGAHHIIFTGVHEMQYSRVEPYLFTGKEQASERSLWYFMSTNNPETTTQESGLIEKSLVSGLGRLNYTYDNRYIINGAIRFDGASQLAPGYKWDYFPAASVAWRISEETFMENTNNIISDLKIRLSYGATGNASVYPYSTFGGLSDWVMYVEFGEPGATNAVQSYRPTYLSAVDLAWERTNQVNLGVDFSLFSNRISGNFDVYKTATKNILMEDRMPPSSGYFSIYANSAETETKGIELALQTINVSSNDFVWRTNLTFSANREKITKLVSGIEQDIANGWFVGEPIDVFYDYKKVGIWQIGDTDTLYGAGTTPGDIIVADLDGNDTINDLDRTIIGNERPKWIATLDNSISYKGLTLSFSIYFKWGHMVDANAYDFDPRMYNNILDREYWTPINQSNENPRLDASITEIPFEYTMRYQEASFIKLRQITLSYNLPDKWFENIPISAVNVYVSSKNTATLYSKLEKGLDPERNGSFSWPLARLLTFGLNVDF